MATATRRDSLVDEFVSITRFTLHGDEGIARLDPARVVFQPADAGVAALREHFGAVQEFDESHYLDSSAPSRLNKCHPERS